jgi:hypothetical protein
MALLNCTVVTAQAAQLMVDPNATGDVAVRDTVDPLAPVTVTQSTDPHTIESGAGVACSDGVFTTENSWLRLFDLDDGHGLTGTFVAESVDWGMETLTGTLPIDVNIYCLDDDLPFLYAFMTLVGSGTTQAVDGQLLFYNTTVSGACDSAAQRMAVELFGDDCEILGTCTLYWIGMNNLGEYAPTYIASASCGIYEPTPFAALAGIDPDLIMVVNGEGDVTDDGGGGVGTIDAVQEAKLLPADGDSGDKFGVSVALRADTALVGAYHDDDNGSRSGSAYVFTRMGSVWTEQAKLLPADGAEDDRFGWNVALDDDTALIGASYDDDNGADSGSAYIFVRSNGVWAQEAKLHPADGESGDRFGGSVAVDGDTALIGATGDDVNGDNSGSAYVFTHTGETWSQQAKLLPSDGDSLDLFGGNVALDGDTALIGAHWDDDNGDDSGSAYVFVRSNGVWTEQAKLLAPDGKAGDSFGGSVAVDGDTALIGAANDNHNGYNTGSAYVFTHAGGVWTQQAKLSPAGGDNHGDVFGASVALHADSAVIGAPYDSDNGGTSGSAYLFTRSGGDWIEQDKLLAADSGPTDRFGWSVAVEGDVALVGAPGDVPPGSAYVFRLIEDQDVPAVGGIGIVLLLLTVLGTGVYFLQRRAKG